MTTDVSVIISSYNQSALISQSVSILVHQAEKAGYTTEIIITDDGSKPSEISTLEEVISSKKARGIEVKIAWQQDLGFRLATSRNNGIKLSTGGVLIFLDGDCIPQSNFLTDHINFHRNHKNSIFVGKRKYIPNFKSVSKEDIAQCEVMEEMEDYTILHRAKYNTP